MKNKLIFNKEITLGGKVINQTSQTFIIAEAGVNHGGDVELAKKMVDVAKEAGADAVKFQAFRTEKLIKSDVEKAEYQKTTTGEKESQAQMLKGLELNVEAYIDLKEYCDQRQILFLITPFDEFSLEELEKLDIDAYKIGSTDATNIPFLIKVAKTGKPILFSTGMCYLSEVQLALSKMALHNKNIILLQCVANYPISDNEANLNVLNTYKAEFDILLGYSDHSTGVGAAPFAIPLGAKVLEKHFTLDKSLEGPDHSASLSPRELKEFVNLVRRVDLFLGKEEKAPTTSEKHTRKALQKCLVTLTSIKKGELFTEDNIIAKRTGGNGISPIHSEKIIGTKATKNYAPDDIIVERIEK